MGKYKYIILLLYIGQPLSVYTGMENLRFLGLAALVVGLIDFFTLSGGRIYVGSHFKRFQVAVLMSMVLMYGLSCVRSQSADASIIGGVNIGVQALLMVLITYAYVGRTYAGSDFKRTQSDGLYYMLWPMGAVIIINVVGYFFGLREYGQVAEDQPPSLLASLLGIDLGRSGFFLTGHPNGFAIFLGGVIVMSTIMLLYGRYRSHRRLFIRITLAVSIFALMILDSRGTAASAMVCILAAVFFKRTQWMGLAKVLVILMPLISLNVVYVLRNIGDTQTATALSRSDGEMSTANGRTIFWKYCAEELSEFKVEHVLGWGQSGHVSSGVALKYAYYLGYPTYTHNFIYQTILDMGYLGLITILLMCFLITRNGAALVKAGYLGGLVFVIFPIYFLFSGFFESTFGFFNPTYTSTFILVAAFSTFIHNEFLKHQYKLQQHDPFYQENPNLL